MVRLPFGMTIREWKRHKREECDMALTRLKHLQYGCVYTPAQREITAALVLLRQARSKMVVRRWRGDELSDCVEDE